MAHKLPIEGRPEPRRQAGKGMEKEREREKKKREALDEAAERSVLLGVPAVRCWAHFVERAK